MEQQASTKHWNPQQKFTRSRGERANQKLTQQQPVVYKLRRNICPRPHTDNALQIQGAFEEPNLVPSGHISGFAPQRPTTEYPSVGIAASGGSSVAAADGGGSVAAANGGGSEEYDGRYSEEFTMMEMQNLAISDETAGPFSRNSGDQWYPPVMHPGYQLHQPVAQHNYNCQFYPPVEQQGQLPWTPTHYYTVGEDGITILMAQPIDSAGPLQCNTQQDASNAMVSDKQQVTNADFRSRLEEYMNYCSSNGFSSLIVNTVVANSEFFKQEIQYSKSIMAAPSSDILDCHVMVVKFFSQSVRRNSNNTVQYNIENESPVELPKEFYQPFLDVELIRKMGQYRIICLINWLFETIKNRELDTTGDIIKTIISNMFYILNTIPKFGDRLYSRGEFATVRNQLTDSASIPPHPGVSEGRDYVNSVLSVNSEPLLGFDTPERSYRLFARLVQLCYTTLENHRNPSRYSCITLPSVLMKTLNEILYNIPSERLLKYLPRNEHKSYLCKYFNCMQRLIWSLFNIIPYDSMTLEVVSEARHKKTVENIFNAMALFTHSAISNDPYTRRLVKATSLRFVRDFKKLAVLLCVNHILDKRKLLESKVYQTILGLL